MPDTIMRRFDTALLAMIFAGLSGAAVPAAATANSHALPVIPNLDYEKPAAAADLRLPTVRVYTIGPTDMCRRFVCRPAEPGRRHRAAAHH
jgi:hypothetical protein